MKRFVVVLAGLLVLPAFAEVAPAYYYEDAIGYEDADFVDEEIVEEAEVPAPAVQNAPAANPRSATGMRVPASRSMPSNIGNNNSATTSTNGRSVASRGVSQRGTSANTNTARTATSASAVTSRSAVARSANATRGTNTSSAAVARSVQKTNSNTAGLTTRRASATSAGATTARAASIVQNDTVNNPLYIGNSSTRAGVRTSNTISARVPAIRVASGVSTTTDTVSVATTTSELDELAELTDYCKAQYAACMDNFCNVLDDNQGRCSCSANLKNYEKTEQALKTATEELQEVAQKIQYIGLTGDEIETLFTQTEAELKMQNTTDATQLKNDLDKIKKMIVEVKSGTASTSDAGISLDLSNLLDFTIDSTGFDLGSLFGTGNNNTTSISNQRGETLYKTATARCKAAVLNSCSNQGVDVSIVTNSYDLEIDKQCLAYERSLSDSNDQMVATVRNAKSVLQKARLLVEQQKNQYDMRGCINALDSCMQDDFVCGSDYEQCLDPTGKYIVNGDVVVGGTPGVSGGEYETSGASKKIDGAAGLYSVWDYANGSTTVNAWNVGSLGGFIDKNLTTTFPTGSTSSDMVTYIRKKIGTIDKDGKAQGMCISVLNRCQDYSYTGKGNARKYNETNDVVRGYLERVLVQIKSKQDSVLADYAESCISDVASCLAQNSYTYSWSATNTYVNTTNPSGVAMKACASVINSCKSVTERSTAASTMYEWLDSALGTNLQKAETACNGKGTWNETTSVCDCTSGSWDQSTLTCK